MPSRGWRVGAPATTSAPPRDRGRVPLEAVPIGYPKPAEASTTYLAHPGLAVSLQYIRPQRGAPLKPDTLSPSASGEDARPLRHFCKSILACAGSPWLHVTGAD